ncbi:MAG: orotidine 5'-phosphate decarboxylase [Acidimicrobiales bacterium]|nr:MAG: orotidine 5'-phosphate decarboxylase [Acidimicrobiales bacterium]
MVDPGLPRRDESNVYVDRGAGPALGSAEGELAAGAPREVRRRLCLALDVDDVVAAKRLAAAVQPWVGVVKVGLELYCSEGPAAVGVFREMGFEVFCDLKLHDIPTTVRRAGRVLGSLGVGYATVHAAGGVAVMRAAVEGLAAGADAVGLEAPVALAVTVLTSQDAAPPHLLAGRVLQAAEAGCGGVVCAARDLAVVSSVAPAMKKVVPGIRPTGAPRGDQARVATPSSALQAGADLLVVGRPISTAEEPERAAMEIASEVWSASRRDA